MNAKIVAGHLAGQAGSGEIHFLLRSFVIFLNHPNVLLSSTFNAGSGSVGHDVLTTGEDGHDR